MDDFKLHLVSLVGVYIMALLGGAIAIYNIFSKKKSTITMLTDGITITCKCGKKLDLSVANGISVSRNSFNIFKCEKCGAILGVRDNKKIAGEENIFTFVVLGEDYQNIFNKNADGK